MMKEEEIPVNGCPIKINRLRFICDKCGSHSKELDALKIAFDESKEGDEDIKLFKEIVAKIEGKLFRPKLDADAAKRRANLREEKLKKDLDAENDWINDYYGHCVHGKRKRDEARDDDNGSTAKRIVDMCLKVILVSIEMGMFSRVVAYVDEAEKYQSALDFITREKLHCARGLAHLEHREYKLAALKFVGTSSDVRNSYLEVIAIQDIATYGGLCALASFDRKELKSNVIENRDFQNFLQLAPKIKELIDNFFARKFSSCLDFLDVLKATLLLDFNLHDHVEDLYAQIRKNTMIRYTYPYGSISLHQMADDFRTSVTGLEEELKLLIADHQIQARVDSQESLLIMEPETFILSDFTL